MALTEKQASQISHLRSFANKHTIVEVMPVVEFSQMHGRFACMVGARATHGEYALAHLGFSKSEATCLRIATEQAAEFMAA